MGTERRTFYGPDIDIPSLSQALADHFAREGYQTQVVPVSQTSLMVQARKEDTLRKIAGMSQALSAVLDLQGEYVGVEIGGAKWADKGVAAGVGAIIFFPALITAGVGAYQQSQLTTKAWQFVEQFIRTHSAFGGSPMPGGGLGGFHQQTGGMAPGGYSGGGMAPGGYSGGMMPGGGYPGSGYPGGGYSGGGTQGGMMPGGGLPPGPAGTRPGPPPINMSAAGQTAVCAACNQAIPAGSKFCTACGAPTSKTCFSCGAELQPNARFCNHCGTQAGQ